MAYANFIVDSFSLTTPKTAHPKSLVRYYARIVCEGTFRLKGGGFKKARYILEFLRPDSVLPWEPAFPYNQDSFDSVKYEGRSFLQSWEYTRVLQMLGSGQSVKVFLQSQEPSSNRIELAPVQPGPALGSPPDVHAWLAAHDFVSSPIGWQYDGNTYSAYENWTNAERADLSLAFEKAWNRKLLGLTDPPPNLATGQTIMSPKEARPLYIAHVAHCLAVEIGGWVPWSLVGLSWQELRGLFSVDEIIGFWDEQYQGYGSNSRVTPAPPDVVYRFLLRNGLIRTTRLATIQALLEWCRGNLDHANDLEPKNIWGYAGKPPVSRMISGTIADTGQGLQWAHWTPGCGGTSDFIGSVLRLVNIPVTRRGLANGGLHFSPLFTSESKTLSHGDDPYSQMSKATPEIPIEKLLVDTSLLDVWFNSNLSVEEQLNNVGRQTNVLAVEYLPDNVLHVNEQDKAEGLSPAQSGVYKRLKTTFTLQELLDATLWDRLGQKMDEFKGFYEPKKKKPPGPFAPKKPPYHPPKPNRKTKPKR
jgi:hypothetical protein